MWEEEVDGASTCCACFKAPRSHIQSRETMFVHFCWTSPLASCWEALGMEIYKLLVTSLTYTSFSFCTLPSSPPSYVEPPFWWCLLNISYKPHQLECCSSLLYELMQWAALCSPLLRTHNSYCTVIKNTKRSLWWQQRKRSDSPGPLPGPLGNTSIPYPRLPAHWWGTSVWGFHLLCGMSCFVGTTL